MRTVLRRWRAFDSETINRELSALPKEDFLHLTQAMLAFRKAQGSGYVVKNYGDGLLMLKDDSKGQGRCLFFSIRKQGDEEVLTALVVYKKESQEAPARVIKKARQRMAS